MKNFVFITTYFLFVHFSFVSREQNVKPDKVEVIFSSKLDFKKLAVLKDSLAKNYRIDVQYTLLLFDKENKLKSISFTVNCNDGYVGAANASNLMKPKSFGFIRNYSKNSVPFITGFF